MRKTHLLSLFLLLILRGAIMAQNPYESLGKVAPVLTLSEGKYQEFMTNDTLVQIGSVLFNTITNEVVSFVEEDTLGRMDADMTTRFLSVDPIGREYPELTPYQFAGNTPIQAIDLDGLEPFFVIGTEQKQTYYPNDTDPDRYDGKKYTFTPTFLETINFITVLGATFRHNLSIAPVNTRFDWSNRNGMFNDVGDRKASAIELADYVVKNHVKGEPITLIGYSHGGNVALQAAPLIYKALGEKVNIITLSTPTSNQKPVTIPYTIITLNPSRWAENPDNPAIQEAVGSMTHFWIQSDLTAGFLSGIYESSDLTYKSNFPKQYMLDKKENDDKYDMHGWPYYFKVIKKAFYNFYIQPQPSPKKNECEDECKE